jgi:putative phosphoribosyl transferase
MQSEQITSERMQVRVGETVLDGQLDLPPQARGVVVFPHGRGISRGAKDEVLASKLSEAGLATLLIDLLTVQEADLDARKAAFRFDMQLLARRLVLVTDWLVEQPVMRNLPIGYLCVGYTAAPAFLAAAQRPKLVRAVVAHDAVADLADKALPRVPAAVLQIGGLSQVPSQQPGVADKQFVEVPALVAAYKPEEVARLAAEWFTKHFAGDHSFQSTS